MNKALVSAVCITYNHEKYIKDAIEGFLSQKTDFDYEIIIHDDASTDATADIVRQYEAKYPDKIRGIYQTENQYSKLTNRGIGILNNYVYPVCKGKYIALCEGDDFWIDPNKLQLQVDFLESHPECVMACHDAVWIDYRDFRIYTRPSHFEERYLTEEEVIVQYHGDFPTASTVFRRDIFDMNEGFLQGPLGDYSLELYAITKGKIYFSPRIMSVYRFMHEGSWCSTHTDNIEQGLMLYGKVTAYLRQYDTYTNGRYRSAIILKDALFILRGVDLCKNLSLTEVENVIDECNEKTAHQYEKYYTCLKDMYKQRKVDEYYPASMKEFVECYNHIYIWGAGEYGQRVANQLLHSGNDFEAFIVSEPSGQEVMGKAVIGIDEIPYQTENVGIIIAVSLSNWKDIRSQFENDGQWNYIYPYRVTELL